ncbi:MFS transporter [Legionella sp. PATHC035]|uniref:MFS transporter n=1 Tax=Legionella sp. PATHC035 TaxID=2992040 RepID=UPI002242E878|nr:MFS transporter [Legionella sp. PATHC035]MCW8408892.1 MFS transporter [Legionella sp. PATHC035]
MKNKAILISSMGNIIEWFDFGLFIFMAPIIGGKFFPQESASTATIDALMVFAIGFICRPIGGIFFGYFGDTRGRAKTLRISILIITLSTFLVGIIPTYNEIGVFAPTLFVLLRLIQGLSIGGEYSGIMIYLAESASPKHRGFITSFAASGANLGFLFATLTLIVLNLFFSVETINTWAWRIPFLVVGIFGSLLTYYRFQLSETKVYSYLKTNHLIENSPFITGIRYAPYQLFKILGLTCMSATFYYFFVGYIATYLEHYMGFPFKTALTFQTVTLITMLFIVPIGGVLGDYFSRKKMIVITSLAILLSIFPCFYLLQFKSLLMTSLALGVATLLSSLDQGNTMTAIVENCPENIRYSVIAFSYNLGNALFGGTTPLIVTLLVNNISPTAPSYYLFFMTVIGLITAITLLPNNQSREAISSVRPQDLSLLPISSKTNK